MLLGGLISGVDVVNFTQDKLFHLMAFMFLYTSFIDAICQSIFLLVGSDNLTNEMNKTRQLANSLMTYANGDGHLDKCVIIF